MGERLTRLGPGRYRTKDGRYEIRMVPRDQGRADGGLWHVGYSVEADPAGTLRTNPTSQVGGGAAITDDCRTMADARDELAAIRKADLRDP